MSGGWKKLENKDGFPYYVNEQTKEKSWDHSKFGEIRQKLDDCNYVKYSMYRVALKFRVLQNVLFMEDVSLFTIVGIFERHRLGSNESSLCLESCDLEAILSDIFFASNKKNQTNIDIDLATDLMINFLYNVFDKDRLGKLQVSSTKIALYLLSTCSLCELYKTIFSLSADHNNCMSRLRLQALLLKLVEITTFLHEENSYGMGLVNRTIEDCFSKSPGLAGVSESAFVSWLESTPKMFSWIPLLHRIKLAEPVVHSIKCTTCKNYPLIGLRYKCMKCLWYTQCQRCFFTGRTSHSHKLSHSMREYCSQRSENNHAFIKKICSLVKCSHMVNTSTIVETQPLSEQKFNQSNSKDILCNIEPLSSPQSQLQLIIKQLETQNKELYIILGRNCNNKEITTYLEQHRHHLATQIEKLKLLRDSLEKNSITPERESEKYAHNAIMESTPLVQNNLKPDRNFAIDLFSPIVSKPVGHNSGDSGAENPLNHNNEVSYGIDDISTWLGGRPNSSNEKKEPITQVQVRKSPIREFHNDLDEALAKLQQILANNFSLDESLCHIDNANLKHAVSEVEGMLTSIIDSVEHSRGSSVRSHRNNIAD